MDRIQKQKDIALIVSVIVYIIILAGLYMIFILLGIESIKAAVESAVISTTIITLVILYLFGRIWKKELKLK